MSTRNYSNTAAETQLTGDVNNSVTTLPVASVAGHPAVPYTIVVDPDTVSEEACLVTGSSGLSLTVTRGYNGTTALAHSTGAVVKHAALALDFKEANDHNNQSTGTVHGIVLADLVTVNGPEVFTNKTITSADNDLTVDQADVTGLVAALAAKIAASIVDAKGDLIVATGPDAVTRLAVGANDRYLRADSGEASGIEWAAPMWGWELVGSADPSSALSITLEDVLFADHLTVITYDLLLSSSSATLLARLSDGGVPASGADYNYGGYSSATGQTSAVVGFLNVDGSQGTIQVARGANAAPTRFMGVCASGVSAPVAVQQAAAHNVVAVYPDLTLFPGAGTMTGRIRAYKVRNA